MDLQGIPSDLPVVNILLSALSFVFMFVLTLLLSLLLSPSTQVTFFSPEPFGHASWSFAFKYFNVCILKIGYRDRNTAINQ